MPQAMQPIVFATSNVHKIKEVADLLPAHFNIQGLADIGCTTEVPETSATIHENAVQKARYVADGFIVDCFAEDTGLEIDALHGEPGVFTARYAGPARDDQANMAKVLGKLSGQSLRGAQFRTVIALILGGTLHTFEGIVRGHIAEAPTGDGGFGYDPIFVPEGYDTTFAQMDRATKNAISHRGIAVRKLIAFLEAQFPNA